MYVFLSSTAEWYAENQGRFYETITLTDKTGPGVACD